MEEEVMAAVEAMVEVDTVVVVGVMVGPLEEAQRLLSSKFSLIPMSKQIIIISGFTGGQRVPVTPVLVRRDKSIIAQKDIKVGEVVMVEEVVTGRTIATEAWKESTVLVISASARPDLVCLEVELELEAVLVTMEEVEVMEATVEEEEEVGTVPIMGNDRHSRPR